MKLKVRAPLVSRRSRTSASHQMPEIVMEVLWTVGYMETMHTIQSVDEGLGHFLGVGRSLLI